MTKVNNFNNISQKSGWKNPYIYHFALLLSVCPIFGYILKEKHNYSLFLNDRKYIKMLKYQPISATRERTTKLSFALLSVYLKKKKIIHRVAIEIVSALTNVAQQRCDQK